MRIGIITPIVILLPRSHNEWEIDGSVDDLVAVATAADRLGYHHLTASEHIAVPVDVEAAPREAVLGPALDAVLPGRQHAVDPAGHARSVRRSAACWSCGSGGARAAASLPST